MSLSSILAGKTEKDKAFREILLSVEPGRSDYYTLSGKKPFSDEYILRVPNALENDQNSSLVGTAFDYMARFRIAKLIKYEYIATDLVAYHGMYKLRKLPDIQEYYLGKYKPWEEKIKKVVMSRKQLAELYEIAVHLAKLEQIYRAGINPEDVDLEYLFNEPAPADVMNELEMMMAVFEENFMIPEIIKKNSSVSFNPNFGIASQLVEGADADIYINGTLYDFKTTKDKALKKKDNLQMIGYYLLDELSYYSGSEEYDFGYYHSIDRIAFYKARYGEVEYYDVLKRFTTDTLKEKLMKLAEYFNGNEGHLIGYIGFGDVRGALLKLEKLRKGEFEIYTIPINM
ncbi:hypothetical protein [Peribacillus frigoritolerans]|uniref:hypothetical protein n=1 Tax=Peribacillus frigoritolerans TaxID=450367 RepID=UPI001059B226|nr:hypothetical protein [Peribacillus frigoritolerans]TDL82089.1 hypothetical protein E2R53_00420 [Peribacillus frigoritolerans]